MATIKQLHTKLKPVDIYSVNDYNQLSFRMRLMCHVEHTNEASRGGTAYNSFKNNIIYLVDGDIHFFDNDVIVYHNQMYDISFREMFDEPQIVYTEFHGTYRGPKPDEFGETDYQGEFE